MHYVMGIDVGTGGVRVMVSGPDGTVAAEARAAFGPPAKSPADGVAEQEPEEWWRATASCIADALAALRTNAGMGPDRIVALACASTSGTVLFLDAANRPLGRAIMYNDVRAVEEAAEVNGIAREHCERFGYRFSASWALPKLLWVKRHRRQKWARAYRMVHATDYIVGKISRDFGVSDTSSALKTGCDLEALIPGTRSCPSSAWPDFIERGLGLPLAMLPRLALPGQEIGRVCRECADATGLSARTKVHAGATDGTAALFASGAADAGDFSSTIGSTLVLKGISSKIVRDPLGRVYCHRHPAGHWLPGGASSTGGECISANFAPHELAELNAAALSRSPTSMVNYPLQRRGERMPFSDPDAMGFMKGEPEDRAELYASHLEGVACVERMCFELLDSLGAEVGDEVFVAGGGVKSKAWLQIRADMLHRVLAAPAVAETAFGACLLAASGSIHADLRAATRAMVNIRERVEPRQARLREYDDLYGRFVAEMARRGYVP